MKTVKIFLNIVAGVIGVATLVIFAGHFGIVDTVKPFIVESGSMSPSIPVGSVVLVRDTSTYNQNDVITFHQNGDKKTIVTHRIIFKRYPNGATGEPTYLTNGDANKDIDQYEVKGSDIVGKVYFSIPYIGYGVNVAKTPKGFILLVIIPATIIVYEEIRSIQRELAKLFRKKEDGLVNPQTTIEATAVNPQQRGVPKAAVILPVVGSLLVFISLSAAYFLDKEQSNGNILSASVSFPTPTSSVTPTITPTPTVVQATPSATPTP